MRRTKSILVIEDDAPTADIIRLYAEHEGYSVTIIGDGTAGLTLALTNPPDLIVLDLMLPGLDGISVCRRLRADSEAPVIMLTARSTEDDKIVGLEAGADDYVVKPFSPRELIARIDAVLRRGVGRRRRYSFEGLTLDAQAHQVFVDGRSVALTPAEFDLLEAFCRAPGVVLTRQQLVEQAFGFDYEGIDRTIDAHVARMRKKIKRSPQREDLIATVFGVGYRFVGRRANA